MHKQMLVGLSWFTGLLEKSERQKTAKEVTSNSQNSEYLEISDKSF
jgi:hypothetical protein